MRAPQGLAQQAHVRLQKIGDQAEQRADGLVALSFILDSQTWVHRRVEHVEVLDAGWVRRTVSSDFTPQMSERSDPGFVPLALVPKEISGFDVRDEQGVGVPVLTSRESGQLAGASLRMLAEERLHECGMDSFPQPVAATITDLPVHGPSEGISKMREWQEKAPQHQEADVWGCLLEDQLFLRVARQLTRNRLLLAAVPLSRGQRRVMSFSYDEHLVESPQPWWKEWTKALAWRNEVLVIPTPAAGSADSYRFELVVPGEDLEFGTTTVIGGDQPSERISTTPMRGNRVLLSLPNPSADAEYYVSTELGARRGGFLLSCLLFSLYVCLVLGFGLVRLDEIRDQEEAITTLLGLLPPILAGLLVRQGEHGMATRLFAGLRRMLLLATLSGLAAVLALVGDFSKVTLTAVWASAFGLSAVAFLAVLGSSILPRGTTSRPAPQETNGTGG